MSNEVRSWLMQEVKAATEAEANTEALAMDATASERAGRMADWRVAKANARVARAMWAEAV